MKGEHYRGLLRGYIFEVVIRLLLKRTGWYLFNKEEDGRVREKNRFSIEIKGRGTWHQIDTPCIFSKRIPFIYPLRLLAEAKYYEKEIQKNKIRSFIGVIKDISENYFIDDINTVDSQMRYTDLGVFFSASGFQKEAVNLAFAHGIKTISYSTNPVMAELKDSIWYLEEEGLSRHDTISNGKQVAFMKDLENYLEGVYGNDFLDKYKGNDYAGKHLLELKNLLKGFKSNFFGMTSTGVLLHFLSKQKFPIELFEGTDEQSCRIHFSEQTIDEFSMWLEFSEDKRRRQFFFDVPPGLEEVINIGGDVLSRKRHYFEAISVSYLINGLLRSLTLKIDKEWLEGLKGREVG